MRLKSGEAFLVGCPSARGRRRRAASESAEQSKAQEEGGQRVRGTTASKWGRGFGAGTTTGSGTAGTCAR
eukprot:627733-Rhodomonas_salina.1